LPPWAVERASPTDRRVGISSCGGERCGWGGRRASVSSWTLPPSEIFPLIPFPPESLFGLTRGPLACLRRLWLHLHINCSAKDWNKKGNTMYNSV
jgi:hypothetical protein